MQEYEINIKAGQRAKSEISLEMALSLQSESDLRNIAESICKKHKIQVSLADLAKVHLVRFISTCSIIKFKIKCYQ